MLPIHPPVCSPIVNTISRILIFVLILTACRATPTPAATPVATAISTKIAAIPTAMAIATAKPIVARRTLPTSQPTSQPTQSAHKIPDALTILTGTATLSAFTIPLSAEWHHVHLTDQQGEDQLQMVGAVNSDLLPLVQRFLDGRETGQDLLVAWPTDPQIDIGLVGYLLPRHDLSLQRYMAAIEQSLRSTPTVTLHEAAVRYALREDVPVGYLHYTLTAPGERGAEGHQYLLFDEKATEVLLLTFITKATTGVTTLVPTPVALSSTSVSTMTAAPPFADIIQGLSR